MARLQYYRLLANKYFIGIMLHAIMSQLIIFYIDIGSLTQLAICGIAYVTVYILIGVRFMIETGTRRQIIENVPARMSGVVKTLIS